MPGAAEIELVLTSLLEESGAAWVRERGSIRSRLRREGMIWECACRCLDGLLLAYGRCPFPVRDRIGFLQLCSEVNSQAVEGALFLARDGRPVFRSSARLLERYGARERICGVLEYNAAVLVHFWGEIARHCDLTG